MNTNIILNADSYKASHYLQYPPETSFVSSYVESRGGQLKECMFFGLQMYLRAYLSQQLTHNHIDEAQAILTAHGLPFYREGWQHIVDQHNGYLPLKIQAVAEGTVLPNSNVMLQVTNTDAKCYWLTSYIETSLLRAIWYPSTVASISWNARKLIKGFMEQTAGHTDGLDFKLHDFGARGATTEEAAALGGCAHLVNFLGTDTISGLMAARHYYDADIAGFSIPAAEHSTMTSWGKESETQAYENMLKQFAGPDKLLAVVSDSYDLWNAIDNIWGKQLKEQVESTGGTLVIRPDSGDPTQVPVHAIERLMNVFGSTTNNKGYRVLPNYLRVIQGDGVNLDSIKQILTNMEKRSISAENIAFGMGGALLQKVNRDTFKFAMKTSAACVDGVYRDVFKDPIDDKGKRSKRGRLALIKDAQQNFKTIREEDLGDQENLLETIYENGEILINRSFDEIRNTAKNV